MPSPFSAFLLTAFQATLNFDEQKLADWICQKAVRFPEKNSQNLSIKLLIKKHLKASKLFYIFVIF